MIEFGNPSHGFAIASSAGCTFNPTVDVVIGRTSQGNLLGGVLYQGYTGVSINMHVAGFHPKWINKDMLWVAFHYPFAQLRCKQVIGQVPSSNHKALEFDLKLGFKEVTRVPEVFPDGDLIVLALREEECRWHRIQPQKLKENATNGWQEQSSAAA